jgi:hypothetical protein
MLKSEQDATRAINLATQQANNGAEMQSSAEFCLCDATRLMQEGNYDRAVARARDSLAYSVGIFHNDYRAAAAI